MNDTPTTHTIAETQRMRFESAWLAGASPSIEETLETVPPEQRAATLEELVAIDMEFRAKAASEDGEPHFIEGYLRRFPELADAEPLMRLSVHEFWVRHAHGDQPRHASYCERFPALFPTEQSAVAALGEPPPPVPTKGRWAPGQRLGGRYELLDKHAEGGFGEVWRAKDLRLDRVVALKKLSDRAAHVADGQRLFTLEVAVTSRLQHPGIVSVHDFDAEGSYYAMQFLSGRTLAEAIASWHHEQQRSVVELRRLLTHYVALCQTVAFAHAHGIVHRDLKPQNVMLGDFGETIVLDWGLAKEVSAGRERQADTHTGALSDATDATDATPVEAGEVVDASPTVERQATTEARTVAAFKTEQGAVLGTPGYMPPEQAEGRIDELSQQTDVYALGAILFELIHGRAPQAVTPSSDRSQQPGATIRAPRELRALSAVADRAMAAQPTDRYAGAITLVAEVERWLADEPVHAHQEPLWIRARRWLKRHRTTAAALAVALGAGVVCAIVVSAITLHSNRMLRVSHAQTDEQRRAALANLDAANQNLYYHRVLLAHNEYENNNVTRARELLDLCPTRLRHWEWWFVRRLCQTGDPQILRHDTESVLRCVELNAAGTLAASLTRDGTVSLWDVPNRERLNRWSTGGIGRELRFLDADRIVVGGTAEKRGVVSVWTLEGERIHQFEAHRYAIAAIAVSDDGQWLATGSSDKKVRIWRTSDWELRATCEGHDAAISAIDFNRDGSQLATGSTDETVKLWSCESGERLRDVLDFGAEVHAVAFDPTRAQLAVGGHKNTIQIVALADASAAPKQLTGHSHFVRQMEYSSDGGLLVSASFDRTVRLWRADGELAQVLRGHDSHLRWASLSRNGTQIASSAEDGTVRIWTVDKAWTQPPVAGSMIATASRDGKETLALCTDKQLQMQEVDSPAPQWSHPSSARIYEVAMDKDGTSALGTSSGDIVVLDAEGKTRQTLNAGSPVLALCFGADSRLYSGALNGEIRCWRLGRGEAEWMKRAHPGGVACLEFAQRSSSLLSAGLDGAAAIWDLSGNRLQTLKHPNKVSRVVAHPHRPELATACFDGRVRIWNMEGELREEIVVGNQWVNCIAYSPDGMRLASGSEESVKLWAMSSDTSPEEVLSLTGHQCIQELKFSHDGEQLILSGIHRGLRIFTGGAQE